MVVLIRKRTLHSHGYLGTGLAEPMPHIFIPPSLRRHTGGQRSVEVAGDTVREVIDRLDERFPGIKTRLCEGDRLKPGLSVAVDSRISDLGVKETVGPDSEVHFVLSVGGGC